MPLSGIAPAALSLSLAVSVSRPCNKLAVLSTSAAIGKQIKWGQAPAEAEEEKETRQQSAWHDCVNCKPAHKIGQQQRQCQVR